MVLFADKISWKEREVNKSQKSSFCKNGFVSLAFNSKKSTHTNDGNNNNNLHLWWNHHMPGAAWAEGFICIISAFLQINPNHQSTIIRPM